MTFPMSRAFSMKVIRALAAVVALAAPALAQGEVKSFAKVDPYTKNDPGIITKAGYVSLGPFRFGDDHTTDQAVQTLGGIPMLWVETEHFKLGSSLPEYDLGDDKQEKDRIQGELARLALKLPDVKTKVRKLDPWLRLHLFALRLEELYARFLSEFDLQESEFPTTPPDPRRPPKVYMGDGRYLGMTSKYTVLVLDKKSSVARYSTVYLGAAAQGPTRFRFPKSDSWLFMTAAEFLEGAYVNDSALTCDVISGVAQNLANGFRGYKVALPLAIGEGIAHWFSRQIDPRYHMFSGTDLAKIRLKDEWNWAPSVRARVEHKVFPSTSDMLGWNDANALEWADHLILWSRMDYLFAREDQAAGKFLRNLKEPPAGGNPPTPEELAERGRKALAQATGVELDQFDAEWSEWVLKTYEKK